jgi:microcystin-dependent protein
MDPFLGETRAFAFGNIPKNWLPCDGRMLAIQQNQALFSLLGVAYGGDGVNNFALPDLRGRAPTGYGGSVPIGQKSGSENVTLTAAEVPTHTHAVYASTAAASIAAPSTASLATLPASASAYAVPSGSATLAAGAVASSGADQAHQNMQPSLVVNWCIATRGIFPSRS